MLCLAMYLLQSVAEREVEGAQQSTTFIIRPGGSGQSDVQTTQRIDLVVIDFREDDLLFHAHAVVAAAIKGLSIQAAEVANPRQGDGKQAIQGYVDAVATQRHLDADWTGIAHD